MRNLLSGLLLAVLIILLVLIIATAGALGIAAIGWLLHHWFDLTQWQGTLTTLATAGGLAFLLYKLLATPLPTPMWTGDLEDEDENEEWEEEPEPVIEPPIVPWRRNRPTQGDLPAEKNKLGSPRKRK